MQFKDQLAFIFQHLKKSKLRIAMTVLATTIGCAFLIIIASVAFGFQKTFEDELLSDPTLTEISIWGDEVLTEDNVKTIKETEHINAVIEKNNIYNSTEVKFENRTGYSSAVAYNMEAFSKIPADLKEGRLPENAKEIVVGKGVATALLSEEDQKKIEEKIREAEANGTWYDGADEGYKESLLGKKLTLTFKGEEDKVLLTDTYTVVGVKNDPPYEYMWDNEIMFHHDIKPQLTGADMEEEYVIHVDTMENVMTVIEELKDAGIPVYSPLEQMDEIESVFFIIKIGLIFVGAIAVIIASIGIFNTMTMAVTERTREIGILKAIGATPALIQRLFLMESLLIGLIGTVLAIIIAYAVSLAGNFIGPILFQEMVNDGNPLNFKFTFSLITPSLLLIATGISLFVALLSGWRPARKATQIEVVKALQQL